MRSQNALHSKLAPWRKHARTLAPLQPLPARAAMSSAPCASPKDRNRNQQVSFDTVSQASYTKGVAKDNAVFLTFKVRGGPWRRPQWKG